MDRRPDFQVTALGASVEEVAAIVGALELALASVRVPAAAAAAEEPSPWLRAGLVEGVDRGRPYG